MKVVIVAPVHRYDDVRVFRKEAVTLAAAGHEVVLYARTPDGMPLRRDGVTVRPVRYRSRAGRFAQLPVLGHRAHRERADVYHVHNPDTLPIAFALRLRGGTVVYDTHEDFRTEILLRQWLPGPVRVPAAAGVAALERLAGRVLDAVVVTQAHLLDRIPGAVLIGNPPIVDAERARTLAKSRDGRAAGIGTDRPLVLGYVGGISADRGLDRMLDVTAACAERLPAGARLLLVGPAVNDDALARARSSQRWPLVSYRGELPQEQAFIELDDADLGLILFADVASHRHIDPNKIYEYLALALPVVATAFRSWVERFGGADAGLFADPREPAAEVARRIAALVTDPAALAEVRRRGVEFVTTRYSWQADGAPKLLALYEDLARGSAARRSRRPRGS